ncbi:hypothetical protein HDU96_001930 [Phlyctochytrium bullatum]|nr:hypothetical protein HDU96_001930 [Phlyctochytrium bullatum]
MRFSVAFVSAFAAIISSVAALPGKSPVCSTDVNLSAIRGMAPMGVGVASAYKVNLDKTSYTGGEEVTINMEGPDFRGFLMYFAPAGAPKERVGTFTIPKDMQSNAAACKAKGAILESDASVITHNAIQGNYPGKMQIKYKTPMGGKDLNLNIIVMQKGAGGFTGYVYKDVAVLKGSGGGGAAADGTSPANQVAVPPGCPAPTTSTCTVTKTVKATRTAIVTSFVTATATQTQVRKCTRKVVITPGVSPVDSAAVPGSNPGSSPKAFGGNGGGQKLFVGKFVTMTCPQNQPSYTISTPPLCTYAAGTEPRQAGGAAAAPKANAFLNQLYSNGAGVVSN